MDVKDLGIFVRVVDHGDFSTAARSLALTPSAVSKAVARLETNLKRQLLKRSSRSMVMTFEGERFLEAARRVLVAVEEAESVGATSVSGTLRVRCIPAFARHQLAPLMPAFCDRYPELQVDFQLSFDRSAYLDDGADVAITSGMPPTSNLIACRFSGSRWLACASPRYLARFGTPKEPSQLDGHRYLNFPARFTPLNEWSTPEYDSETFRPAGTVVANQPEMLLALSQAGTGIARLPEYQVAKDLRSGTLVRLFAQHQDEKEEPLYLLHHARRHVSPRIRAFLTFIEDAFARRPWTQRPLEESDGGRADA